MKLNKLITVIGAHVEGEIGRVITGGVMPPKGSTMFECMENLERENSWLRDLLINDPRGSVNVCVNLITPPIRGDADIGLIIMEPDFFVPMSGSNIMCAVTVALETGILSMKEPETIVRVDTPAGLVEVVAECQNGKCRRVSFRNIASFVMQRDKIIEVPKVGSLRVDVAYGGMIYCLVESRDIGVKLSRDEARDLVDLGERIKVAAAEQLPSIHPENSAIHTVNQTEFVGPIEMIEGVKTSKNAVIVSPGRIDRCPCGTGTSARMALLHERGELAIGENFRHTSIIDTEFDCRIVETTNVGDLPAVIPTVSGRGWLTGVNHYGVDPEDPFPRGYRLSDTWFQ